MLPKSPRVQLHGLITRLFALALCLLLCHPDLAFAGKKEREAAGFLISITLLPLGLYPLGLAWHLMIASLMPQRSQGLSLDLEEHYWKTTLLGLSNCLALFILMGVFGDRAPGLSGLCLLTLLILAGLGIHGIVRGTGEWVLERCGSITGEVTPMKALAVGWFVCVYVACVPVIGWFIGAYWTVRGIGGVILQLAGQREDDKADAFAANTI